MRRSSVFVGKSQLQGAFILKNFVIYPVDWSLMSHKITIVILCDMRNNFVLNLICNDSDLVGRLVVRWPVN